MQTDATTPNIIGPTMLGIVASVLAVVCKRMQQLPTILGPAVHRGKDTTHKTLERTMSNPRARLEVAVQTGPTLLRYASEITEEKKCWELFQTLRNNSQEPCTGIARRRLQIPLKS